MKKYEMLGTEFEATPGGIESFENLTGMKQRHLVKMDENSNT